MLQSAISVHAVEEIIQYEYDNARQITAVIYSDGTEIEYVYDRSGNRLFKTVSTGLPLNNSPDPAENPSIPDGATEVSTSPVLIWTGSDPDAGDDITYFLHFGECGSEELVLSGTQTNYTPGQLKSITDYCWQVVTRDNHNADTAGPVWSFTTANDSPALDVIMEPVDGETIYTAAVNLKWNGADPNPDDRVTYDIYYGTSSPPPLVQADYQGMSFNVLNLSKNTTYYWKIVSRDDHNASSESPVWSFTTSQITTGQTVRGYHDTNDDIDTFSISLNANDVIKVRVGFALDGMEPYIKIFDTDGTTLLCEKWKNNFKAGNPANRGAEVSECHVPVDGTYTITISENGSDYTGGEYDLAVELLNNTEANMAYGETVTGVLTAIPDLTAHTFSAGAGDAVMVKMTFVNEDPDPEIRLYDPDGNYLDTHGCSDYSYNNGSKSSAQITACTLPLEGVYTLIASEWEADEVGGEYNLTLVRLNNPTASQSFGQTLSGTLLAESDINIYTFAGSSGDRVRVRMGFAGIGLDPELKLFNRAGTTVLCQRNLDNYITANKSADIEACFLPDDGIYTIAVSELLGDQVGGDYGITVERLNNTVATMSYGDTAAAELITSADLGIHTFSGATNDRVNVRMGFVTNGPDPWIRIHGPDGTKLTPCSQYVTNGNSMNSAEIAGCTLPDEGTYTIVACERYGVEPGGSYALAIERMNNTVATLSFGETVAGTLSATSDANTHAFMGNANDRVIVRMGFTSPGPDPEIRIYDPAGMSTTCQASRENNMYNNSAEISHCLLPDDGVYSIVASESGGDEIGGDYNLTLEILNNTAATISYGQSVSQTLTPGSGLDSHTFTASAYDTVRVAMAFSENGPDPQVRIFSTDGSTELCEMHRINDSGNGASAVISGCELPESGTYTIIANEYKGDETGGQYSLTLECTTGICNATPEANAGGPYSSVEGQELILDASGSVDPDGMLISYEWDVDDDGTYEYSSASSTQVHTFSQNGTYTINLRITDNSGATSKAATEANISDTTPTADFTANPISGPVPLTVEFDDTSTCYDQPLTYEWDFDNDGIADSLLKEPSFIYNNTGNYTIKLKVTDSDGSTDSLMRTDYITAEPSACRTLPVRIAGTSPAYFSSIQSAYNVAQPGDIIQSQAAEIIENLDMNREIAVTLDGGYDCDYAIKIGDTVVKGNVMMNMGTIFIENIIIDKQE